MITKDECGKIIMCGIKGLSLEEEEKDFLQNEDIAGIILFSQNYESPRQLAELTNSIQLVRNDEPFFIAVDQEGGRVKRFKTHFTQWPSMNSVARLNSPKIIFDMHTILAAELKYCGVNWNISPCCDVLYNETTPAIGDRSFGNDPEIVANNISAAIRGMEKAGLICTAKHFPGHGPSSLDSHFDLPKISKSLEELEASDLIPFVKAAKCKVETIMIAHIIIECLDKDLPATLSSKVVDYLRNYLRFHRPIVSDDLEMKAISDHFGESKAPTMAINAGINLLIYKTMDKAKIALKSLKIAYDDKSLNSQQLAYSVKVLSKTKQQYLKNYEPVDLRPHRDFSEFIGNKASQEFLKDLLEKLSACHS